MGKDKALFGVLMIALLWLAGCATLGDVVQEKAQGGGTAQVYPVDVDQAWEIAMTVFRWEGSDAIENIVSKAIC
jgi:hypothetical protein